MCHSVVFHQSAIFRLVGADNGENAVLQHLRAVDGLSFFCVILTLCSDNVFWHAKSYLSIDTSPTFGLPCVVMDSVNFVAEKSCRSCPCVGNQGFCLGEFQFEVIHWGRGRAVVAATAEAVLLLLSFLFFLCERLLALYYCTLHWASAFPLWCMLERVAALRTYLACRGRCSLVVD